MNIGPWVGPVRVILMEVSRHLPKSSARSGASLQGPEENVSCGGCLLLVVLGMMFCAGVIGATCTLPFEVSFDKVLAFVIVPIGIVFMLRAIRSESPTRHSSSSPDLEASVEARTVSALSPKLRFASDFMTAEDHWLKGEELLQNDRNEDALRELDKSITLDRSHFEAWADRGLAMLRLGRMDEAACCYREVTRLNPELNEGWINLAGAALTLEQFDEALAASEHAIRLDPNVASAWLMKGNAFMAGSRFRDALNCFSRALWLQPGNGTALLNKGVALSQMGKNEEALNHFDLSRDALSQSPQWWMGKGIVFCQMKRVSAGLGCLRRARRLIAESSAGTSPRVMNRKNGSITLSARIFTLADLDGLIQFCSGDLSDILEMSGIQSIRLLPESLVVYMDQRRPEIEDDIKSRVARHPQFGALDFEVVEPA